MQVSPKSSGWIETLHVDFTGKAVTRGEPLFEIYAPELVTAQEAYLVAFPERRTAVARQPDGPAGVSTATAAVLRRRRQRNRGAGTHRAGPQDPGDPLPRQRRCHRKTGGRREPHQGRHDDLPDCRPVPGVGGGARLRIRAPLGAGRPDGGHDDPVLARRRALRQGGLRLPLPAAADARRAHPAGIRQRRPAPQAGHVRRYPPPDAGRRAGPADPLRGGAALRRAQRGVRGQGRRQVHAARGHGRACPWTAAWCRRWPAWRRATWW